jgi:hypothetical protein
MDQDHNYLSQLGWRAWIGKAPTVSYLMQKVSIPSITLPPAGQPNPLVVIPEVGDHIQFDYLSIQFKVDEDLTNYLELFNWITALGFPENSGQFAAIEKSQKDTISVHALSGKQNPRAEFIFNDAFPVYLGTLDFTSTLNTVDYVECNAIFAYTYFNVVKTT